MRFVPVKTTEQQASQLLHRGRVQLVRQRTMLVNALRAHLAEFGIVEAQGLRKVGQLIAMVRAGEDTPCPMWRAKCCGCWRVLGPPSLPGEQATRRYNKRISWHFC
jgi:hypothetical protein